VSKAGAYPKVTPHGTPRLLALPGNIGPGWGWQAVKMHLAYSINSDAKYFKLQVNGVHVLLFFSVTDADNN